MGWEERESLVGETPHPTPGKASWLVRVLQLDPFATEKEKTEKNLEKPLRSLLSLLLLFSDGVQNEAPLASGAEVPLSGSFVQQRRLLQTFGCKFC